MICKKCQTREAISETPPCVRCGKVRPARISYCRQCLRKRWSHRDHCSACTQVVNSGMSRSWAEVCDQYNSQSKTSITRQRCMQIAETAMKKVRHLLILDPQIRAILVDENLIDPSEVDEMLEDAQVWQQCRPNAVEAEDES